MRALEVGSKGLRLGVAACVTAVGAFLLVQLNDWPPHEDETLALFVGGGSLGSLVDTVLGERGGAPLHFLLAWLVAHAGGGLSELRLVSAVFACASIPVVAALATRIADRTTGLVAAALASGSWVLLFHGVYARMYSLFLFTSALSYLALLVALERGGRKAWALWAAAVLATVATHPYGALVLATQGLFVLVTRRRLREAALAFAVVGALGTPFWLSDLVLAGRFDVGVGGGGGTLGGPAPVLRYLRDVAGDFSAGYRASLVAVFALTMLGLWKLARTRRTEALLAGCVFAVPALVFLVARVGSTASPESRHLIFALPFFSALIAFGLVQIYRRGRASAIVALASVALLLGTQVAWARAKTPQLFSGEPRARIAAREAASDWLARTGRPDDVLLGYDPLFLDAWRRSGTFSRTVVPRADAKLAANVLRKARKPLGRGVWVLDAWDNNNAFRRLVIPVKHPYPKEEFDVRAFGPFLVIRSREPVRSPEVYLDQAARVMILGKYLWIGDADVNYETVRAAAKRFEATP